MYGLRPFKAAVDFWKSSMSNSKSSSVATTDALATPSPVVSMFTVVSAMEDLIWMTLPSTSSVRNAMFGVKRGKRAREEEEDDTEGQQSSQEQQNASEQRTSSPENQKNSHEKQQHQLKQVSPAKMAQMLLHYQNKVRSGKRLLATLKREKERDLACLVDQLALLESRLRREQRDIQEHLAQKDTLVQAQRLEIERLSRDNERLSRDNRRLAHKVKKYASAVGDKDGEKRERRVKFSRLDSIEDEDTCIPCDNISNYSLPNANLVTNATECFDLESLLDTSVIPTSISGSSSQYEAGCISSHISYSHYQSSATNNRNSHPILEAVNHNLIGYRPKPDRVLHKPPIAEKPKGLSRNLKRTPYGIINLERPSALASSDIQTVEEESDDLCTTGILPRNIHLVDEESDDTCTTGSSASEPSSPEGTLKSVNPNVISLAGHIEEELDPRHSSCSSNLLHHLPPSDSSLELHTSEISTSKSYIMDEYEVTSGYNSDAVSDHDYENIRFGALDGIDNNSAQFQTKESINNSILSEKDEHNSSVIFNPIGSEQSLVDLNEDQNIYSNIEFSTALQTDEEEVKEKDTDKVEEMQKQTGDESQVTSKVRDELNVSFCSTASNDREISKIMDNNNSARSRQSITNLLDGGDHMTANFEEFNLDALELEKDDHSESCVESLLVKGNKEKHSVAVDSNKEQEKEKENLPDIKNERVVVGYKNIVRPPMSPVGAGGGQYEKFLEATGLSQKSLLTPTRNLINHRSVVKPRDIKHRNKMLRNSFPMLSTLQEAPQIQHRHYTQPYI